MLIPIAAAVIGIALLYAGGELLVANAIRLARWFGLSSMAIGLTVVAFATSAPELAATIAAALQGKPAIAVGNAMGSNLANLCLILGIAGCVFLIETSTRFIRRELAFMVFVTIALYPLILTDYRLDRIEGLILLLVLAVFLRSLLRDPESRQTIPRDDAEEAGEDRSQTMIVLGVVAGGLLLVLGAEGLVWGADHVATSLGVPQRVIGLTLVAIGTSLPELAAALAAARRGEGDLVLGNVVGSNIFNILCILGTVSLIRPLDIPIEAVRIDYWIMLGVSLLALLILTIRRRIWRSEGALLLVVYGLYLGYLFR